MRLAELLGCRMYDADGVEVGGVHDVRFVVDRGPAGDSTSRVAALIVGSAAVGHRLGYVQHEMSGPGRSRSCWGGRRAGPTSSTGRTSSASSGPVSTSVVNGLDVLIAWVVFGVFLDVLARFLLRKHVDPVDEANRRTDGSRLPTYRGLLADEGGRHRGPAAVSEPRSAGNQDESNHPGAREET